MHIIKFKEDGEPYFSLNVYNKERYNTNSVKYRNDYLIKKQEYNNNKIDKNNQKLKLIGVSVYCICAYGNKNMAKQVIKQDVLNGVRGIKFKPNIYIPLIH